MSALVVFFLLASYVVCASAAPVQVSVYNTLASGQCNPEQLQSTTTVTTGQCIQNPTGSDYVTMQCNGAVQVQHYSDAACTNANAGMIFNYASGSTSTSCYNINGKSLNLLCNPVNQALTPLPVLNLGPNTASPGSVLIATGTCPISLLGNTMSSSYYFPTATCINSSDGVTIGSGVLSEMWWCNGNSVIQTVYSDPYCRVQAGMAAQYDIGQCYQGSLFLQAGFGVQMQVLNCNGAKSYNSVTMNSYTPPATYFFESLPCSTVGVGTMLVGGTSCNAVNDIVTGNPFSYLFSCQSPTSAEFTVYAGSSCSAGTPSAASVTLTSDECVPLPYPHTVNGITYTAVKIDCGGGVGKALAGPPTVNSGSMNAPSILASTLLTSILLAISSVLRC